MMHQPFSPEVDAEQLMHSLRAEVAKSRQCDYSSAEASLSPSKRLYTLDELLRYDDSEFIANAYQGLLQREPDPEGSFHFLARIRSGSENKVDVLREIRYSQEGLQQSVPVAGLLPPSAPAHSVLQAEFSESPFPSVPVSQADSPSPISHSDFKPSYTLSELLQFDDEHFVCNAFLALLRRQPDSHALQYYLHHLRQGLFTKIDILGRLRYSREGRSIRIKVKGLLIPFLLHSTFTVPLVGHLIATISSLPNARALIRRLRATEARTEMQAIRILSIRTQIAGLAEKGSLNQNNLVELTTRQHEIIEHQRAIAVHQQEIIAYLTTELTQLKLLADAKANKIELTELITDLQNFARSETVTARLADTLSQIRGLLSAKADSNEFDQFARQLRAEFDAKLSASLDQAIPPLRAALDVSHVEVVRRTQQLTGALRNQLQDQKYTILDQQRRLGLLLEETRKRLPEPLDTEQLNVFSDEAEHLLDAMYAAFEDRFRGTRDDIKDRQQVYLQAILESGAGTEHAPVLDLGCGRGEWLELLRDRQLIGRGVDLNQIFVRQCLDNGLHVVKQDALAYLRELPNNALGAITGFHIIEHLPTRILVSLLDEALRTLRPGGMAIFETPNPENLVVGACNFYMDPTHHNPMPPAMTQFLVEARGFVRCEIRRLHNRELIEPLHLLEPETPGTLELNRLLQMANEHYLSAPDYAVIGYKAGRS
ncbi:MAG: DUF4214 domain-containing protein [Candidatus Competibacter sp.]